RDREPARDGDGRDEEATARARRTRRALAAFLRAPRQAQGLLCRAREVARDAELRARGLESGEPHRRPSPGGRACFDNGPPSRGRLVRGWIWKSRYRSRPENEMKRAQLKRRVKADAVLTEIVRNGVIAVTEEMKTNLMRTAYNMIVYEALDFTVGLYTAAGE